MGRTSSRDRGSSTVEYSLMVAALAAALVGVIAAASAVVGSGLDPCSILSSAPSMGGTCPAPGASDDHGDHDANASADLGVTTDDS